MKETDEMRKTEGEKKERWIILGKLCLAKCEDWTNFHRGQVAMVVASLRNVIFPQNWNDSWGVCWVGQSTFTSKLNKDPY